MRITCTRPAAVPTIDDDHTRVWYTYKAHQQYGYMAYNNRVYCYVEIWQWLPGAYAPSRAPYWRYRCGTTMRQPVTVAEWYADENRTERFFASVLEQTYLGSDVNQLYGFVAVLSNKVIYDTE